jgi:hypothetical protein
MSQFEFGLPSPPWMAYIVLQVMKAYAILSLIALMSCSCTQPRTMWPMRVDNSEAFHLDPKKSPLEEHIYVLSPLKAAKRDSEEYRARLRAGLRHQKTIDHPGGDYLYVPPSRSSNDYEDSHVYILDRSKGKFYVTVHWTREM